MGALKNMPLFEAHGSDKIRDGRFIDYLARKYRGQEVVLHLGLTWYLARWSLAGACHRFFPLFAEDADFKQVRPVLLLQEYNQGLVIRREAAVSLR